MTDLHKFEQSGVGIIWQCVDCGWESDPLNSFEGMTEPPHRCNPERYLQIEDPNALKGRLELVTERGRATAIPEKDLRQTHNLVVDHYPDLKWRREQIGNELYILIATRPEKR
jgi:hypothetical protein